MSESLRCRHCGEVIGVYEPLVTFVEGRAWETSRLAEPLVGTLDGRYFHRSCFEHRHGDIEIAE